MTVYNPQRLTVIHALTSGRHDGRNYKRAITALTRDGRTVAARGHVAYSAIVPDVETIRSLYIEPTSTSAECRWRTNVTTAAVNMIKQHGARERETHTERETMQSTCR